MGRYSEKNISSERNGKKVYKKMLNRTNHQGSEDQNHNITSHLLAWLSSKRQEITCVGNDVEKRKPLCIFGGKVNW